MVRAATSGMIDYTGADPRNRTWRIRHLLLLEDVARREEYAMITAAHQHWLALVAHGSLKEESFNNAKLTAGELLREIQNTLFPWRQPKEKPDAKVPVKSDNGKDILVDDSTQALIAKYKQLHGTTE
jgi:hypothetical protein